MAASRVKFRIKLDRKGIGQIAKSAEMAAHMLRRAERVAAAARSSAPEEDREFIRASSYIGRRRARASVLYSGGLDRELRNRILGQAIDRARG